MSQTTGKSVSGTILTHFASAASEHAPGNRVGPVTPTTNALSAISTAFDARDTSLASTKAFEGRKRAKTSRAQAKSRARASGEAQKERADGTRHRDTVDRAAATQTDRPDRTRHRAFPLAQHDGTESNTSDSEDSVSKLHRREQGAGAGAGAGARLLGAGPTYLRPRTSAQAGSPAADMQGDTTGRRDGLDGSESKRSSPDEAVRRKTIASFNIDTIEQLLADATLQPPRGAAPLDPEGWDIVEAFLISQATHSPRLPPDVAGVVERDITRFLAGMGICDEARLHSFAPGDKRNGFKIMLRVSTTSFHNIARLCTQVFELRDGPALDPVSVNAPPTGPRFEVQIDSATLPLLEIGRYSNTMVNMAWEVYKGDAEATAAPAPDAFFLDTVIPDLLRGVTHSAWIYKPKNGLPRARVLLRSKKDLAVIHARFFQDLRDWAGPPPPSSLQPPPSPIDSKLSRLLINSCWLRTDPRNHTKVHAFAGPRKAYGQQSVALCVSSSCSSVYNTLSSLMTLLGTITTAPAHRFGLTHFSVLPCTKRTVIDLRFGCDEPGENVHAQADTMVSLVTRLAHKFGRLVLGPHIEMKFDTSNRTRNMQRCPFCRGTVRHPGQSMKTHVAKCKAIQGSFPACHLCGSGHMAWDCPHMQVDMAYALNLATRHTDGCEHNGWQEAHKERTDRDKRYRSRQSAQDQNRPPTAGPCPSPTHDLPTRGEPGTSSTTGSSTAATATTMTPELMSSSVPSAPVARTGAQATPTSLREPELDECRLSDLEEGDGDRIHNTTAGGKELSRTLLLPPEQLLHADLEPPAPNRDDGGT